jgi:hypothetical protein
MGFSMLTLADESMIAISWMDEQGWIRISERIPRLNEAGQALLGQLQELDFDEAALLFEELEAPNPGFALQAFLAMALGS